MLTSPSSVSFGLVPVGSTATAHVTLIDAGGGAGAWDVAVEPIAAAPGASLAVPAVASVPGTLDLTATTTPAAADGDLSGFVRLTRGTDVRRIPFWLHVSRPALGGETATPIGTPGLHAGSTSGKPALVSRYRYPEVPSDGAISASLQGPEQAFRVTLKKPATNFGVVITRRAAGVQVEPRVVVAGDENRLTGYPAIPINLNPYLVQFGDPVLAAGAVRVLAGAYDVVFDSPTAAGAGSFTFRYWVNDTTPPKLTLLQPRVSRGTPLAFRATDAGSGVDPATAKATVDGRDVSTSFQNGVIRIRTSSLKRGAHRLRVQVSDYQESRNMENVPRVMPNTRVLERASSSAEKPDIRLQPDTRVAQWGSRSSIVGSASRSACTLRTNSSSSVETTRSFAFRFSRSRARRASAPTRRSNLGHSAATTMPMPIASSTIQGQLTAPSVPGCDSRRRVRRRQRRGTRQSRVRRFSRSRGGGAHRH